MQGIEFLPERPAGDRALRDEMADLVYSVMYCGGRKHLFRFNHLFSVKPQRAIPSDQALGSFTAN